MNARKPLVIANWKLNGDLDLVFALASKLAGQDLPAAIAVCPPGIYIRDMLTHLKGVGLKVGAQDVSQFDSGAYTGDISAQMLRDAGCSLALVGHSERREHFGDTNAACFRKLQRALGQGLHPVLCIGETAAERESGVTEQVIARQLEECLGDIDIGEHELSIAYEPIWAIGTGLAATPEIAQEVHGFIRRKLADIRDYKAAEQINLLYGGSVTRKNVSELMAKPDIDGVLVGGASLDIDHFLAICEQVGG